MEYTELLQYLWVSTDVKNLFYAMESIWEGTYK